MATLYIRSRTGGDYSRGGHKWGPSWEEVDDASFSKENLALVLADDHLEKRKNAPGSGVVEKLASGEATSEQLAAKAALESTKAELADAKTMNDSLRAELTVAQADAKTWREFAEVKPIGQAHEPAAKVDDFTIKASKR